MGDPDIERILSERLRRAQEAFDAAKAAFKRGNLRNPLNAPTS